jgi:hypothetical protein
MNLKSYALALLYTGTAAPAAATAIAMLVLVPLLLFFLCHDTSGCYNFSITTESASQDFRPLGEPEIAE